ncbi:Uncharacterised protein [Shigella sonnei]|nr:Uncharacterised protein [Shigella sonnei]CSG34309.1 Uncharacterised protein [Shigella sonnei]CSH30696.1 Uncharacterised protein [Shigella sonnei]CSR94986.1 Uncharacterised protein [Shigella sonnei]
MRIAINDVKSGVTAFINNGLFHRAVSAIIVNRFQGELRTEPRQCIGRPDSLLSAARHRATARFQQTALENNLQWGMRFLPLAFCRNFAAPFIIQRQLNFIQRAGKVFGSYIAEFKTR